MEILKKNVLTLTFLISLIINLYSQQINTTKKFGFKDSLQTEMILDFKFISNLIVIPISINGSDSLNFILDTGLRFPIITLLPDDKSITFEYVKETIISGLGEEEDSKAWITYGNQLEIKDMVGQFISVYVLDRDRFNLSSQMGIEINGLIGFDIFENFIVEIDYVKQKIKFYSPSTFEYKKKYNKWITFPIELYNSKPYMVLPVTFFNDSTSDVKLLIDNGSSDALWLFTGTDENINYPENGTEFYLGQGLNGNIYGKQNKIKSLQIGRYTLEDVTTSYPDSSSVRFSLMNDVEDRNGSIGSEVFRRFNVLIDYSNLKISLKPNSNFSDKFYFNLSGIDIITPLPGFPLYQVSQVRKESPAYYAGVKVGDQFESINGIDIVNYSYNDVIVKFRSNEGQKIKLKLNRDGKTVTAKFRLTEM